MTCRIKEQLSGLVIDLKKVMDLKHLAQKRQEWVKVVHGDVVNDGQEVKQLWDSMFRPLATL